MLRGVLIGIALIGFLLVGLLLLTNHPDIVATATNYVYVLLLIGVIVGIAQYEFKK